MTVSNLEQLRMLVETVETGSFSACARKLGKVQSAVSQGIANLEIDLNVELFDRNTRKPLLTPEGERLLSYARSVLQQVSEMDRVARAISLGEELKISLVLDDGLFLTKLGAILQEFSEQFPATRLQIISTPSPDIQPMVLSGRADIGLRFLEMDLEKGIDQCYIGDLPFYAVCAPEHELAQQSVVSLQDLIKHRQLLVCSESGQHIEFFPAVSNERASTTSFHSLIQLVRQGMGWAYLPAHLAEKDIHAANLHKLKISFDHKTWSPPVEFIIAKSKALSPGLLWLSEKCKHLFD